MMTTATLEGLVCVAGGGGAGTGVRELNETVHQNSQSSKRIHSLWKTGWQVFKKFKIELLYDLGTPLLSIYPKEMKAKIPTDMCTPRCITFIHNNQKVDTTQASLDG